MGVHYGSFPPGLPQGDPEDCGPFCVWWYTQPKQKHSKTTEYDTLWAYALRGQGKTWRTSDPRSGFTSREQAFEAGTMATNLFPKV